MVEQLFTTTGGTKGNEKERKEQIVHYKEGEIRENEPEKRRQGESERRGDGEEGCRGRETGIETEMGDSSSGDESPSHSNEPIDWA